MHVHGLLIAVALALVAQTALPAPRMICRFTGKVMVGCPCPDDREAGAKLEKQGCCEVLKPATAEPASRQLPSEVSAPARVLLPSSFAASTQQVDPRFSRRAAPSPPGRTYLRLCQLLI